MFQSMATALVEDDKEGLYFKDCSAKGKPETFDAVLADQGTCGIDELIEKVTVALAQPDDDAKKD